VWENKEDTGAGDYTAMGIGLSANQMDYVGSETAYSHAFWTGGTKRLTVQSTAGNNVVVADGLTLTDGNLVVAAGHGIDFSAQTATSQTGASTGAEVLDHYEEGTWTPVVAGSGGGAYTYTASTTARYTRIGNLITVSANIDNITTDGTGQSGYIQIQNTPFSKLSDTFATGAVTLQSVNMTSGNTYANIQFISGGSTAILFIRELGDNVGGGDLPVGAINSGTSDIRFSITYTV
jgi:hypothetical protein